jgi:hypothetical protein
MSKAIIAVVATIIATAGCTSEVEDESSELAAEATRIVASSSFADLQRADLRITISGRRGGSTVDVYGPNRLEAGAADFTRTSRSTLAQVRAGGFVGLRFEEPVPSGSGRGIVESVRSFVRIDGGPIRTTDVRAGDEAAGFRAGVESGANHLVRIPATARRSIELWTEVAFRGGERVWESNGGRNFIAEIVPTGGATIRFDATGEALSGPSLAGRARAGSALTVHYDTARMDRLLAGRADRVCLGHPYTGSKPYVPGTVGWLSFRDGAGQEIRRISLQSVVPSNTAWSTTVRIPDGARKAAIWFQARCPVQGASGVLWDEWDSNFGRNFVVSIQP